MHHTDLTPKRREFLESCAGLMSLAKAGGPIRYSGDANMTDAQIAALPFEMYRQGYHYYWRTHAHPGSTFRYTTSSLLDLMRWDATDQIELITQPLLMIAGSKADRPRRLSPRPPARRTRSCSRSRARHTSRPTGSRSMWTPQSESLGRSSLARCDRSIRV